MKNVKIYSRNNGADIKVEGDLWGIPSIEKNIKTTVNVTNELKAGDKVSFKTNFGKITEGIILGITQHHAVVEFNDLLGNETMKEIELEKLIKLSK